MPTLDTDNSIRKAAVLIRSLDADAAAAILTRLSADEARALRDAVRELGEIDDNERRLVADELRSPTPRINTMPAGVELAIGQSVSEPSAVETYSTAPVTDAHSATSNPLNFLATADAAALVTFLRHEQPQTVAVVLSYLPAERAAAVLAELSPEQKLVVLDRLADLGDADPESLSVITTGLRDWITEHQQRRIRRTERLGTIEAILAAAPANERETLLAAGADRDWSRKLSAPTPPVIRLAEIEEESQPQPDEPMVELEVPAQSAEPEPQPIEPLVSFEDVERFPVSALAQVMRHAPADHLMLALAGGSEKLVRQIAGALPRRQAAALRQRVSRLGPTPLRDIEQAQRSIALVASELLRKGWITLAPTKH